MRWFKVAAIVIGVIVAFLVVSSVVGFILEAMIAVLVVAAIALGVKMALGRKQVSWKGAKREVRAPRHGGPQRGHNMSNVDEELARLKRENGA